jgi:hypothetical protein
MMSEVRQDLEVIDRPIAPTMPATRATEPKSAANGPESPQPSTKTPQAFYAEVTRRADVRAILEDLADR